MRWMMTKGSSERRSLRVIATCASVFHYQPWPDRDARLRPQIVALAQRHRYYVAETIDLNLHQAGERVARKRV